MRIAYLSDSTIPSKKANSVHVMQICNALSKNHDVMLTAFRGNWGDVSKAYGTSSFRIEFSNEPLPKIGLWLHAFRARRILRQFNPDIVFGRSLFSCYLATRLGYKVAYETHNPFTAMDGMRKKVFTLLCTHSNFLGLVTMSNALKQRLKSEQDFITGEKILAVHDGATVYNTTLEELNSYTWPGKAERTQVGYVGTISKGRGLELIVQLSERLPQIDFHIIGGTVAQMERLDYYPDSVTKENLHFHGFVSPSKAVIARKKCDILLAPYQENVTIASGNNTSSYMSPLKIFEYMEAKKAIIASDLPVLHEVLNADNCMFATCDNVEEWEKAILLLNENKNQRDKLSTQAYEDLVSKYTWDIRAKKILEFINK